MPKRGKALIDLAISIACPEGTYGRIAPRSGLGELASDSAFGSDNKPRRSSTLIAASKHSIDTGAGVIDADYRGPVKVLLFNYSDEDFTGKLLFP